MSPVVVKSKITGAPSSNWMAICPAHTAPAAGGLVTKCIQGLLKDSGERVLLSDLVRTGGRFSTNGISFEKFVAMNALVGDATFAHGEQAPRFDTLEIPLSGFEEWLRLGSIKLSRADGNISASYEMPNDLTYACDDGSLVIVFDVDTDRSGMLGTHAFSLKESASLRLHLNRACPLGELQMQYGMFEDLLKLLTGSDYGLDWPRVSLADGSRYLWYFSKVPMVLQTAKEPGDHRRARVP
jgi:hypothetical protein